MKNSSNIPTMFVIFGATGDLMAKKITPSLFDLFQKKELPKKFKIVGFSRGNFSKEKFRSYVFQNLIKKGINLKTCSDFCNLFEYQSGFFQTKKDYQKLSSLLQKVDDAWGVCANKLFYLAVPPQFYKPIFNNLSASGLTNPCSKEEGWTRVLVEKPFGKDLKTAQKLDNLLGKLFKEVQIYRIDHYLAKEMMQNILAFRFSNNLLEKNWGNELIEKINIRLLENIGVEDRGAFYDGVGALRDVGQNHLLQMIALATMKNPGKFDAKSIRKKRAEILKTLEIPSSKEIAMSTFRAQYNGYRNIKGVKPNSQTETYFKTKAFLKHPRWQGVPIILEGGKRLGEKLKEIELTFKHSDPCLCPKGKHQKNRLIIRLEPKEEISISFWSKKPGLKMEIVERNFKFNYRTDNDKSQYTEEYEKLLLDAIAGDQGLFVSSEEVKAMWKFIDPIIFAWQKNLVPLKNYNPGSDEIVKESKILEEMPHLAKKLKKEIAIIGLGKMGSNLAKRLREKEWKVIGYNKTSGKTKKLEKEEGIVGVYSLGNLTEKLSSPKLIWLMVPSGKPINETIDALSKRLAKGDIIIDGGNSFYRNSIMRYRKLKKKGINFMDVGVSGGPNGARNGSSLMIGGDKKLFENLEGLFQDLAAPGGYAHMGGAGAGHFVKMVHNGIEYGTMQAIAEGFAVMKKSPYKLDLKKITQVYNHGSVIESKLIEWLRSAFDQYGKNLDKVSGSVAHTGEGAWTVKTAEKLKVPTPVIEDALKFRIKSEKYPSYIGKILSALRNQFGGHSIKKK